MADAPVLQFVDDLSGEVHHAAISGPTPPAAYAIWTVINDDRKRHLEGKARFAEALIQFQFVAKKFELASTYRDQCYEDMDSYQSDTGVIASIAHVAGSDTQPLPQSGEPIGPCVVTADYQVWYRIPDPNA